jgi:hypothetical protein
MTSLIKYDAARSALAECKAVDEVKAWADKAEAMRAYGRMAKDKTLEVDAAEIRIRAERRLGEMIAAQKSDGGLSRGAAGAGINQHTPSEVRSSVTTAPKLADAGISKDLSARAQKLAAVPEAEFEAEVGEWRGRVQAEGARVTTRLEKAGEKAIAAKAEADDDTLAEAHHTITDLAQENERLQDRLAVEAMDASEEEKTQAAETIRSLRSRVVTLEAEVAALKVSRDTYMREASEAKKSAIYWRKRAEKVGAEGVQ